MFGEEKGKEIRQTELSSSAGHIQCRTIEAELKGKYILSKVGFHQPGATTWIPFNGNNVFRCCAPEPCYY